ncbi:hypothetical protein [Paenibacillus protaetiae]|uniref:Uncharacterized protein n=1 Tax=Paenibacillus protaetiae TaxID=2509456 RepID=A0A4P6EZL7_9BACL|nr:hypothetical protein [Paenibacillus protaetiae]QAY66167.1 hypothetical protein ET464_06910 [Paenibacillus protaetiae]
MRIRLWKRFAAAAAAVAAVIAVLSWLPGTVNHQPAFQEEIPVFRVETIKRLTNTNMVDALIALQLNSRLSSVKWSNSVLSLELLVDSDPNEQTLWFQDMDKLVRFAFSQTDNVNRILLRYMDRTSESGRTLLFGSDVRRSDSWLQTERDKLPANPLQDELWRQRLRISLSPAWITERRAAGPSAAT